MDSKRFLQNPWIQLHTAVLLFGFTPILGKLIQVQDIFLVLYRIAITLLSLCFVPSLFTKLRNIRYREWKSYTFIGIVIGLHWLTFYGSIKLSNASIGVSMIATVCFFTSILEPIILRQAFKQVNIVLGLIVVFGLWLIYSFNLQYGWAMFVGLVSAFLSSLFSCLNKKYVSRGDNFVITFVELSAGLVILLLMLPMYKYWQPEWRYIPTWMDLFYLAFLAIGCTTIAFILQLNALRSLSAFACNLAINLEPIYGIILAYFLLHENKQLNLQFYIGAAIIISSVFIYPLLNSYKK